MFLGSSSGYLHPFQCRLNPKYRGFQTAHFDDQPVDVHKVIKDEPAWSAAYRLITENKGTFMEQN